MAGSSETSNHKTGYFNRELSWLAFNRRVLDQAEDVRNPLLERLKYLSFVSSNLDEFYEIRVAGLIQQVESNITKPSMDGLGPKEQLRRIHSVSGSLVADQYQCWQDQIIPALTKENIPFKSREELNRRERSWLKHYFEDEVHPVLTPLAIDPAHPFPFIPNLTLSLIFEIKRKGQKAPERQLILIPQSLPPH